MRLFLPASDDITQSVMQQVSKALMFGRLHAVREKFRDDGMLVVSGKVSDSFGFVDHPRLIVHPTGELEEFRCDCFPYRDSGCFCRHCAALADAYFDEVCSADLLTVQEELPAEAPTVSLSAQAPMSPPPVAQISYAFCNSRRDLYPGKDNPRIPLARYYQMFGQNAYARRIYAGHTGWGGSCFGFTTSASMFFTPADPMNAPDFKSTALHPAELSLTSRSKELHMTLHTLLESMQILQYSNQLIQRPRHIHLQDPNCLDNMCQRVLHFQQTGTDPVAMGVARNSKFEGCHAVYPYWLESVPQCQDRLHIYDPNHPMKTRYAYLEKDENGHYTNWRFAMNDHTVYAGNTDGQLFFDDYSDYKNAWDNRGSVPTEGMMSVPRNVAIANAAGEVLFRVTAEGTESFCDDIYQIIMTDMGEEAGEQVMLNLPAGSYLVQNEDPQRQTLEIMLTHTQQSISVRTNADQVEITADDGAMTVSTRIPQSNRSYSIELDAIFEEASRMILLEGTTGEDGLTFGCYDGTLRAQGSIHEELASLYIDEELTDLSCIEQMKVEIPHRESIPQRKRSLTPCSDLTGDAPAEDVTD